MTSKSLFSDAFHKYASSGKLIKDPLIDGGSLSSCSLTMMFGETVLAKGTGFFWRQPDGIALVTAWHNVSGLHHTKRTCLSSQGGIPDRIRFRYMSIEPKTFQEHEIPLYLDEERTKPRWFVHGEVGSFFDICYLGIAFDKPNAIMCINDKYENVSGYVPLGSDVFAVGFPHGVGLLGIFPVWKRGSVATELALPVDAHPKFLIDMTGRSGMSGSPVFRSQDGVITTGSGPNKSIGFGLKREFIGLYSGRASSVPGTTESSELGFVWRADIVSEVISSSTLDECPEVGKGTLEVKEIFGAKP